MNAQDDNPVVDETPADESQAAVAEVEEQPAAEDADLEEDYRLSISAEIETSGPCRKHVQITVPRADLDHFYEAEVSELSLKAQVPGFRVGHVPKKLVQKRFRQELSDQVKQKVLIASLEQVAEDYELDPINEPDIDVESIDIPEEGDFQFEFDVEVRPEFDLPQYEGLEIERPVREVSDEDVEDQLKRFLAQYGQLETRDDAAEEGDSLSLSVEFVHNGETIHKIGEMTAELKPVLAFQDARIENFGELMAGVKAGDEREVDFQVSPEAETLEMRGETVTAKFKVKSVKRLQMPELTPEFLTRLGVEDEEELRDEIRSMLHRQTTYQQRQAVRGQVLDKITESADWELPEELVMKQVENALRREILEMQQAGFTTPEIRARENELRQRAVTTTTQALKEHFVLDKIATEKDIQVTPAELEMEIQMMAMQRGESPRRVRARLQKSGMDENLEAQIRERKAVDLILESAKYKDVPMDTPGKSTETAVGYSVCGTQAAAAEEEAGLEDE
ncbi:MAG: trigger factor [Planctomycetaceae bacterium]